MGKLLSKKKKDKLTITTEVPEEVSGSANQIKAGESSKSIEPDSEKEFATVNEGGLSDRQKKRIELMQKIQQKAKQEEARMKADKEEAVRVTGDGGYESD